MLKTSYKKKGYYEGALAPNHLPGIPHKPHHAQSTAHLIGCNIPWTRVLCCPLGGRGRQHIDSTASPHSQCGPHRKDAFSFAAYQPAAASVQLSHQAACFAFSHPGAFSPGSNLRPPSMGLNPQWKFSVFPGRRDNVNYHPVNGVACISDYNGIRLAG